MTIIAQHVAALLLHWVSEQSGERSSLFQNEIKEKLADRYGIDCSDQLIESALEIIDKIGGKSLLVSPLTGDIVKLSYPKSSYFFGDWPSFQGDTYDREQQDDAYAEARQELHTEFPILVTYFEAGEDWIQKIFERLAEMSVESPLIEHDFDQNVSEKSVPAADRLVSLHDNKEQLENIEQAISLADEAVRASNDVDEESRNWIRAHLEAGQLLISKGTKILKDAILSILIKPLQNALNYVVEEKGKELILSAIKFLWNLIS